MTLFGYSSFGVCYFFNIWIWLSLRLEFKVGFQLSYLMSGVNSNNSYWREFPHQYVKGSLWTGRSSTCSPVSQDHHRFVCRLPSPWWSPTKHWISEYMYLQLFHIPSTVATGTALPLNTHRYHQTKEQICEDWYQAISFVIIMASFKAPLTQINIRNKEKENFK